jgi:hypothetical protein
MAGVALMLLIISCFYCVWTFSGWPFSRRRLFLGCHVESNAGAQDLVAGSYPQAQSLQEPVPQSRTFPAQDTRCKRGHAFANRSSRDWRLLEKDEQRLVATQTTRPPQSLRA